MAESEPPLPSDVDLLRAHRAGDVPAFTRLVERYQDALLRHARMLLSGRGSAGSAEDAVQEVFLKVARNPPDPDDESVQLGAWLHRVTRNRCLDMLRSDTRRRDREVDAGLPENGSPEDPALAAVDARDTRGAVERTLQKLPEDQREAVTLRLLEERSYAEIASITGRKVGTVGWLISQGMKALARELSPLLEA
ncbi:ECF RNA polymerase sigma-E factor [Planctomycetes bacterium Poly30]|uniref:ECF RNA polymerase sigma-E factor n=1 Tax=Saltatorellus ferox TaxID=2528018 RepID=A0A518ELZ1_9BACT|nr:ECF RNA polymerase sigma-E factor [Planctomycetes bacterium Poly30]